MYYEHSLLYIESIVVIMLAQSTSNVVLKNSAMCKHKLITGLMIFLVICLK